MNSTGIMTGQTIRKSQAAVYTPDTQDCFPNHTNGHVRAEEGTWPGFNDLTSSNGTQSHEANTPFETVADKTE